MSPSSKAKKKKRVPFGTLSGNKPLITRKNDVLRNSLLNGKENAKAPSKADKRGREKISKKNNFSKVVINEATNKKEDKKSLNYTNRPRARKPQYSSKSRKTGELSPIDENHEEFNYTKNIKSNNNKDFENITKIARKILSKKGHRPKVSRIQNPKEYSITTSVKALKNIEQVKTFHKSRINSDLNNTKRYSPLRQYCNKVKDSPVYKMLEVSDSTEKCLNSNIESIIVNKKSRQCSSVSTMSKSLSKSFSPQQKDNHKKNLKESRIENRPSKNRTNEDKTPKLDNLSKCRQHKNTCNIACNIADNQIISNTLLSPNQHNIQNDDVINTMLSMPHLVGTSTLLGTVVELSGDDSASEITFIDYTKRTNKKVEKNTTEEEKCLSPNKWSVRFSQTKQKQYYYHPVSSNSLYNTMVSC